MRKEISLEELLYILKKKGNSILMWGLCGLILATVYTFFIVTPQYQSTTKLVVNQTQSTNQVLTDSDIQTNLNLINTYQSIIMEPIILGDVIKETGSDLTVGELRNSVSIQRQEQSLVFGVTVEDSSPYTAAEYANAIAKTFQSKIGKILDVESVTILSQAVPNPKAVSPNLVLNLVLGLLQGVLIGVGLVFLAEFMDKTVRDERFIESLGWTNLGNVMQMSDKELEETRFNRELEETKSQLRSSARRV